MEKLSELINMVENGFNNPDDYILFVISMIIALSPLIIKILKIISLNDFDRLLIPKNESSLQHKIVKIFDYFLLLMMYLIPCTIFSLVFKTEIFNNNIGNIIMRIVLSLFTLTLIPIMLKSTINLFIKNRQTKLSYLINKIYGLSFFNYILVINLYLSFIIYAFLLNDFFNNVNQYKDTIIVILLYPILLLSIYRSYTSKYNFRYICNIVSEKEFNDSMLILYYTLDKDRMIFHKPDDDFREIFMYDRSSAKYFKFTRVNIL